LASQPNFGSAEPPRHVPPDRIVDFDYVHPDGFDGRDIYVALKRLHDKPDILWSPRYGGHWVVTRAEDMRWIRSEPVLFSRTEFVIPRGSMNTLMPPVNVDPPYHSRFRAVINPAFTPGAVRRLQESARVTAARLIAQLKPRGRCEFVDEVARIMPATVFFAMLELPPERTQQSLQWARDYINARDQETKDRTFAVVAEFLTSVLNERDAHPGTDLFSRIAAWRKNPRFQSEAEVIGMATTCFLGGLDTTASLMAFTMHHLASHPKARRHLVEEPAMIPKAAEEYIRRNGLGISGRLVTRDVARKGITMKRDEMVMLIDALASLDERAYPNPFEVDFGRDNRLHDTFGNGVHRCVGEHLARMELIVLIEEWLKAIPEFRLDPALPPRTYSGVAIGMEQLGLCWEDKR
jgi:cytochrome P450